MPLSRVKKSTPYQVPIWAKETLLNPPESGRLHLGNFPTPLHQFEPDQLSRSMPMLSELNIDVYVKRDDMSGGPEMGGNKIRKLEFLLADALHNNNKKYDSVVTIGGEQSNHCRATACAARMVGLEPHLILRTKKVPKNSNNNAADEEKEGGMLLGLTGNLLFDRLVGSTVYTCTPGEYGRVGSATLVDMVCASLREKNRTPYPIPVGGSNGLGSWGYIEAVHEISSQLESIEGGGIDHVVFSCGSGGTAAGIALGFALSGEYNNNRNNNDQKVGSAHPSPQIHAMGVCDHPDYFYQTMTTIAQGMGLLNKSEQQQGDDDDDALQNRIREYITVHQAKGLGYAVSTTEELEFIRQFALDTGIVLDPVYSGKALYNFYNLVKENPDKYRNQKILFWHTGGSLGLYEQEEKLMESFESSSSSPVQRLDVYGNKKR